MFVGRGMRRAAVSAVALIAVAGLPVVEGATAAEAAPVNGRIAYTHLANLNADRGDALSLAPTGGAPTAIATGSAGPPAGIAAFPMYSPDGTQVVFSRGSQSSSVPLFLAAADGSGKVQLTQSRGTPANRTQDAPAGFSPDGRLLAFSRVVDTGSQTLQQAWVVNLATKVEKRMGTSDNVVYGFSGLVGGGGRGVFSADSKRVVFADAPLSTSAHEIYRAEVKSGAAAQVTDFGSVGVARYPVFSTDGSRITFGAGIDSSPEPTCAVVSVPAASTKVPAASVTPLTWTRCEHETEVPAPAYSPDGATIAFSRPAALFTPAAAAQLMAIPAAGGTPTPLTALPAGGAVAPVWSPDGSRIAFSHLTAPADPSSPPTLVVAVVAVKDPSHAASPITPGGADLVSSWQAVPVGGDPCQAGTPVPAGFQLIEGTDAQNKLSGTSAPEVIRGLGGNDVLRGGGGNDILCGDNGRDRLIGGAGNDTLAGGGGRDELVGGRGDDVGVGGPGADTFRGVEKRTE